MLVYLEAPNFIFFHEPIASLSFFAISPPTGTHQRQTIMGIFQKPGDHF